MRGIRIAALEIAAPMLGPANVRAFAADEVNDTRGSATRLPGPAGTGNNPQAPVATGLCPQLPADT